MRGASFIRLLLWIRRLENVGGDRSFHGVDRLGHADRDGQKRSITTCRVASDALASDVKAYDAGQIQVSCPDISYSEGEFKIEFLCRI